MLEDDSSIASASERFDTPKTLVYPHVKPVRTLEELNTADKAPIAASHPRDRLQNSEACAGIAHSMQVAVARNVEKPTETALVPGKTRKVSEASHDMGDYHRKRPESPTTAFIAANFTEAPFQTGSTTTTGANTIDESPSMTGDPPHSTAVAELSKLPFTATHSIISATSANSGIESLGISAAEPHKPSSSTTPCLAPGPSTPATASNTSPELTTPVLSVIPPAPDPEEDEELINLQPIDLETFHRKLPLYQKLYEKEEAKIAAKDAEYFAAKHKVEALLVKIAVEKEKMEDMGFHHGAVFDADGNPVRRRAVRPPVRVVQALNKRSGGMVEALGRLSGGEASGGDRKARTVVYHNTGVQTHPPSDAATFEKCYGYEPRTHEFGLAALGRLTPGKLHPTDLVYGEPIVAPVPATKPNYHSSSFQTVDFEERKGLIQEAEDEAARVLRKSGKHFGDEKMEVCVEKNVKKIVHSEQFSFKFALEDGETKRLFRKTPMLPNLIAEAPNSQDCNETPSTRCPKAAKAKRNNNTNGKKFVSHVYAVNDDEFSISITPLLSTPQTKNSNPHTSPKQRMAKEMVTAMKPEQCLNKHEETKEICKCVTVGCGAGNAQVLARNKRLALTETATQKKRKARDYVDYDEEESISKVEKLSKAPEVAERAFAGKVIIEREGSVPHGNAKATPNSEDADIQTQNKTLVYTNLSPGKKRDYNYFGHEKNVNIHKTNATSENRRAVKRRRTHHSASEERNAPKTVRKTPSKPEEAIDTPSEAPGVTTRAPPTESTLTLKVPTGGPQYTVDKPRFPKKTTAKPTAPGKTNSTMDRVKEASVPDSRKSVTVTKTGATAASCVIQPSYRSQAPQSTDGSEGGTKRRHNPTV